MHQVHRQQISWTLWSHQMNFQRQSCTPWIRTTMKQSEQSLAASREQKLPERSSREAHGGSMIIKLVWSHRWHLLQTLDCFLTLLECLQTQEAFYLIPDMSISAESSANLSGDGLKTENIQQIIKLWKKSCAESRTIMLWAILGLTCKIVGVKINIKAWKEHIRPKMSDMLFQ